MCQSPRLHVTSQVGFYLIYAIEEASHAALARCGGTHHGHAAAERGDSGDTGHQLLDTGAGDKEGQSRYLTFPSYTYLLSAIIYVEPEPAFLSAMRGFLVVLALSLHEMFEGIALGLATTTRWDRDISIDIRIYPISRTIYCIYYLCYDPEVCGCCSWPLAHTSSSSRCASGSSW